MTYEQMNNYFLNYLKNDKTGRAVMLTGKWGSGKSFYIKSEKGLINHLKYNHYKSFVVSLYGYNSVSEISKAIFMKSISSKYESFIHSQKSDAKLQKALANASDISSSEVGSSIKIVGKCLINNIITSKGLDFDKIKESDWNDLFESVNLANTLLILEDIERTQIDLVELLGYVNNLCENEEAKILLVANESEILNPKYEDIKDTENGKDKIIQKKIYSDKAELYMKMKEKVISDTIQFVCDYSSTIKDIINSFNNDDLKLAEDFLLDHLKSYPRLGIEYYDNTVENFREFIVACQKSCDIFAYMISVDLPSNDEFKKCITIGIIFYLQNRLKDKDLKYSSTTSFDISLSGIEKYPLMRFCYVYCNKQILDRQSILNSMVEYEDYLKYIDYTSDKDSDLKIIRYPYKNTENDVNKAIKNILERLDYEDNRGISFNHYGTIISNLVNLKYDAYFDEDIINDVINKILNKIKGKENELKNKNSIFPHCVNIKNREERTEIDKIVQLMTESLKYKDNNDYISSDEKLCNKVEFYYNQHQLEEYFQVSIIDALNLESEWKNIKDLNPNEIMHLRFILFNINYDECSIEHVNTIRTFLSNIKTLMDNNNSSLDKIQTYQLRIIINQLESMLENRGL